MVGVSGMATQSENADIAVLQNQMKTVSETMIRVETKLDVFNTIFVTKAEFVEFKQRWFLSHAMSGIAGGVITGVAIYILTQVIK